jgi:hypothetical protein
MLHASIVGDGHMSTETRALDILIWVSDRQYTIESYIQEAKKYGACRKFGGRFPADVEMGKSRVFLAYPYKDPDTRKAKKDRLTGQVFGYFTVEGVLVVGDSAMQLMLDQFEQEGKLQKIKANEVKEFHERGCGFLSIGGTYLVSNEDMRLLQSHADSFLGQVTEMGKTVKFKGKRWRGYKYVDGDAILAGKRASTWFNVEDIRGGNWKIRHTKWLAEREEHRLRVKLGIEDPEPPKPKKKRETYGETIMTILDGGSMDFDELVIACIKKNPPLSTWPKYKYRSIVNHLKRKGFLEVVKEREGKKTVKFVKALG